MSIAKIKIYICSYYYYVYNKIYVCMSSIVCYFVVVACVFRERRRKIDEWKRETIFEKSSFVPVYIIYFEYYGSTRQRRKQE